MKLVLIVLLVVLPQVSRGRLKEYFCIEIMKFPSITITDFLPRSGIANLYR